MTLNRRLPASDAAAGMIMMMMTATMMMMMMNMRLAETGRINDDRMPTEASARALTQPMDRHNAQPPSEPRFVDSKHLNDAKRNTAHGT